MRRNGYSAVAISAALLWTGCNELLDLDRFSVRDAATQREDGGEGRMDASDDMDASRDPDACVLTTYYADQDGDGYGDPATALESCAPIAGRVTNGDDCDDSDETRHPGATETCDNADQDCDGAVDEGLMRPLGEPIVVEPDLGFNDSHASLAAFSTGYAVVWRTDDDATVYASFYGLDGAPILERDVVKRGESVDGPPRAPTIARHVNDLGIEKLIIAYLQPSHIRWTSYSTNGSSSNFELDIPAASDATDLRLAQVGNRMSVFWKRDDATLIATFNPDTGALRGPLEIRSQPSDLYGGLATVAGPQPHILLSVEREDEISGEPFVDLVRIDDVEPLSATSIGAPRPSDVDARCAALGTPSCMDFGVIMGSQARVGEADLAMLHLVWGLDGTDAGIPQISTALASLRPQSEGSPEVVRTHALSTGDLVADYSKAIRGSVVTLLSHDGAGGRALLELPLTDEPEGAPPTALTASQELNLPTGAMHGNHGAFIGSANGQSRWNVSLLRIGCEP